MGVRFNKRFKILPYVTMNVGKNGMSLTIGPRGKTLNIGSTGVNVNVSMGQGVGYSKRLITWRKLNLLSWLGIGGAAAVAGKKGKSKAKNKKATAPQGELSLDDAIAEAGQASAQTGQPTAQTEQPGCSWGCLLGILAVVIILVLAAAVVYLYLTRGQVA